jgi:hypothetical protein
MQSIRRFYRFTQINSSMMMVLGAENEKPVGLFTSRNASTTCPPKSAARGRHLADKTAPEAPTEDILLLKAGFCQ